VRLARLALELGVKLDRDVPRVRRQLDDLDELAVERSADDAQTGFDNISFATYAVNIDAEVDMLTARVSWQLF